MIRVFFGLLICYFDSYALSVNDFVKMFYFAQVIKMIKFIYAYRVLQVSVLTCRFQPCLISFLRFIYDKTFIVHASGSEINKCRA